MNTVDDQPPEPDGEPDPRPVKRSTSGATVLAAAMLGLGEVLEPQKTAVEIAQVADDDEPDDLPFPMDFGDLPSLS